MDLDVGVITVDVLASSIAVEVERAVAVGASRSTQITVAILLRGHTPVAGVVVGVGAGVATIEADRGSLEHRPGERIPRDRVKDLIVI